MGLHRLLYYVTRVSHSRNNLYNKQAVNVLKCEGSRRFPYEENARLSGETERIVIGRWLEKCRERGHEIKESRSEWRPETGRRSLAGPKEREDRYRRGTCQRELADLVSSCLDNHRHSSPYNCLPASLSVTCSPFSSYVSNNDFSSQLDVLIRQTSSERSILGKIVEILSRSVRIQNRINFSDQAQKWCKTSVKKKIRQLFSQNWVKESSNEEYEIPKNLT